jgi:hypothetical protein
MLLQILKNQEKIMADVTALQAADTALKAEVTQAITDWASQLSAANGDQAAVDAVTADMNSAVAQLQAADSANAGAGSGTSNAGAAPVGTTTTTDGTASV